MLLVLAALAIGLAVFFVFELASEPARERKTVLERAARYGRSRPLATSEDESFRKRALKPLLEKTAKAMLKLNRRVSLESLQWTLQGAGMHDVSAEAFLAAKGLCGGAGFLLGLALGSVTGGSAIVLYPACFSAVGYIAPGYIVNVRARHRREEAVAQLPDALDLMAVSVEAGLSFDSAINKLTDHMQGPLIEEFELMLGEMRVGSSRPDALKKMGQRLETPEMSSFVRSLIQADQLGISLGRILRVQATDTRLKRQAAAEEKAAKAPIKMLFPTVLFIFPAMFLVILGPAMLQLKKVLGF
ncbi:MAG: type II secretion system F family protein [Gaiellaceae bacterium]